LRRIVVSPFCFAIADLAKFWQSICGRVGVGWAATEPEQRMANLQERNGKFRIQFFHQGRLRGFSLGKVPRADAESKKGQVEYLLRCLKQGIKVLPHGVGIVEFLKHDGQPPAPSASVQDQPVTLARLWSDYESAHANGSVEASSLKTTAIHLGHLRAKFGDDHLAHELAPKQLQDYINWRAKIKGHRGKTISPVTIEKEIISFATVWNWGVTAGLLKERLPSEGLRYPKADEKPPFQTYEQIQKALARGGLSSTEAAELWDTLYLTPAETTALLEHVRWTARQPWVYPAIAFAAYTGARRSEVLRALVRDVHLDDSENAYVTIREKKRNTATRTMRQVPLDPHIQEVLTEWLALHPGGPYLFCQPPHILRSKSKRSEPAPITRDQANDHSQRTLAGSKWAVLRGWHVLRHTLISRCASAGIDQRLIDDWVGHQTEAMRRRYRHLFPRVQQQAIRSVFADGQ
jgi:integrase